MFRTSLVFPLWEFIIDDILQLLHHGSTGSVALNQLVECIGPVHIQVQEDMVTDMRMIVMKAATEAGMKIGMVMGKKGMMTGMADMGTHLVVMEIVMAEITKNALAEMVTGMMITVEEVEVLMITSMAQEVGAPT